MLLGSDVVALFPSLSAEKTARCVRRQAEKSEIRWENIDYEWLCLYIHLNRHLTSDLERIEHLLPKRRRGKRGVEPGMKSKECMNRYVDKSE